MTYTAQIQKAIKFAAKTHQHYQDQKRKGKRIPYITHPLTVGLILSLAGADEDVIVAGILHDTIEDSTAEKKVTKEMLAERFGEKVAKLVESVTEQDKSLPWEQRKAEAIGHIAHFLHDSVLLKSADIISNVSEILDDHARYGDEIFDRFSAPEPRKERTVQNYLKVIAALKGAWEESPLMDELHTIEKGLTALID